MLTSTTNEHARKGKRTHPDPDARSAGQAIALEAPQVCADCDSATANVMVRMRPGRYAPPGIDPRSEWWLCGRCWLAGARPNKLGNFAAQPDV